MTWSELVFWLAFAGLAGTTFGFGFAVGWELRRLTGRLCTRLQAWLFWRLP